MHFSSKISLLLWRTANLLYLLDNCDYNEEHHCPCFIGGRKGVYWGGNDQIKENAATLVTVTDQRKPIDRCVFVGPHSKQLIEEYLTRQNIQVWCVFLFWKLALTALHNRQKTCPCPFRSKVVTHVLFCMSWMQVKANVCLISCNLLSLSHRFLFYTQEKWNWQDNSIIHTGYRIVNGKRIYVTEVFLQLL